MESPIDKRGKISHSHEFADEDLSPPLPPRQSPMTRGGAGAAACLPGGLPIHCPRGARRSGVGRRRIARRRGPGEGGALPRAFAVQVDAHPAAVDIAQAMDAWAGTGLFTAHTCYYAHVLGSDLPLAVDLVADIVQRPLCRTDDVRWSVTSSLGEIAMRDATTPGRLGGHSWRRCSAPRSVAR